MMRRAALSLTLLCLLPIAAQADEEPVTIAWKPKAGQTTALRFEARGLGNVSWVFAAVAKNKVLDVAADGKVRMQIALSDVSLTVAGQDITGQIGDLNTSAEATYLPNGVQVTAPEGSRARIDAALQMMYPDHSVKVGDTWKRTVKADAAKGLRAGEATYKYEGIETVGKWRAYKIAVTYRETEGEDPISARGTEWLAVDDGQSVKSEYRIQNGPFAPEMPPEPEAEIVSNRVD